ncbi:MAG TPA: DnaB-like helicase C-terminal domain-containing protein, partial [Tepidisphaeraceae bacterium]
RRLLTGLDEGDPGLNSFDAQSSFDCITGGFPFRQNTIIGGRPGSGKSAFVKDILIRLAQGGWRVGIVTIEEDRIKIGDNALAHESPVQNWKIQRDVVSECEHETLKHYAEEFKGLQFFIDDTCTTLTQVEASLRRMKRKYECDVLVVDHLHLIDYESGRKNESRNDQITVISKRIKALYRRLDVVGISVCQLNRQGEGIDNMPSLTTLREGGALEQDGDLIVFVHRRDYYRDNPAMTDGVPKDHLMELNVAKNKAGGTGVAKAYWDGDHQRVGNWNNGQGPMNDARMEADAQQALSYL